MTSDRDLIVEIVAALAEAEHVPPEELDYNLYEHVDPEVIARLDRMDGSWKFSFEVDEHEVTITDDGRLFVDGVLCRENLRIRGSS